VSKIENKPPREALLDAATKLFGEAGPAAVSTRQIAAEAGVNSGLIHRHFGTKDAMLREVLERLAGEISRARPEDSSGENSSADESRGEQALSEGAASGTGDDHTAGLLSILEATQERSAYWKLLARCILDGQDPSELQEKFPTVARVRAELEQLQNAGDLPASPDARTLAGLMVALGLGWLVFEPFLVAALSADGEVDVNALRKDTRAAMLELIARG